MNDLITELQARFDNHLTDLGPTITHKGGDIEIVWESSNDGHPTVTFDLCNTGDEEELTFDLDILVSNNDNVGPKEMLAQTMRCMNQFYELGLNTRFGRIVGDH